MRLQGYEGLAVAIIKQGAHDYCECLRWMRDHHEPGVNAMAEIEKYTEMKAECVRHKAWSESSQCTKRIKHYKHYHEMEQTIRDIKDWMHTSEYQTISQIDGDSLLKRIEEQLAKDPKFRVLLGDDI